MAAGEKFPFECCEWVRGAESFDAGLAGANRSESEGEFFNVGFPVAANFEESPECGEADENRMSVPAAL